MKSKPKLIRDVVKEFVWHFFSRVIAPLLLFVIFVNVWQDYQNKKSVYESTEQQSTEQLRSWFEVMGLRLHSYPELDRLQEEGVKAYRKKGPGSNYFETPQFAQKIEPDPFLYNK
jgi:hypothetical protein